MNAIFASVFTAIFTFFVFMLSTGEVDKKAETLPPETTITIEETTTIPAEEVVIKSDHEVEILGNEIIIDWEGDNAIATHILWTNNSNDTTRFDISWIDVIAFQDGIELIWTAPALDNELIQQKVNNECLNIKPGTSLEVTAVSKLRNTSSVVEIEVRDISWKYAEKDVLLAETEFEIK